MTFRTHPYKGFKFRPRALRRAVLLILERRASLTTAEIASCAYFHGGPVARPGWRTPNESEMQATYRAVRHLVATGRVLYVGRARRARGRRTHKVYTLAKPRAGRFIRDMDAAAAAIESLGAHLRALSTPRGRTIPLADFRGLSPPPPTA